MRFILHTSPHKLTCVLLELKSPISSQKHLFSRYQQFPDHFCASKDQECPVFTPCSKESVSYPPHIKHVRKCRRFYRLLRHYLWRREGSVPLLRESLHDPSPCASSYASTTRTLSYLDLLFPGTRTLQIQIKHDTLLDMQDSRQRVNLGFGWGPVMDSEYLDLNWREGHYSPLLERALYSPPYPTTLPQPPVDPIFAHGVMIN